MKLHPRYEVVRIARNKISDHICRIMGEYKLTLWEIVGILLEEAMNWKKYGLREERHPDDPTKKADEE